MNTHLKIIFTLVLAGCGTSHLTDAGVVDAGPTMLTADAGGDPDASADPGFDAGPPDAPPPVGSVVPECVGPREGVSAVVRIRALSEGSCRHAVTEGQLLEVRADGASDGVVFVLHEGFDGAPDPHCEVTVEGVGADIADDLRWAVGTVYAGLMREGSPGVFWIADGEGSVRCPDGFTNYHAIFWAGGSERPDDLPPIFVGHFGEIDHDAGCLRDTDDGCRDFEAGYRFSIFDRACNLHASATVSSGSTVEFVVDGLERHLRTLLGVQQLECPIPGDDTSSIDIRPGSWVAWTTGR